MSDKITVESFRKITGHNPLVLPSALADVNDKGKQCFELAKKFAVGFFVFAGSKGYVPTDQSFTMWKRQVNQIFWSEPITSEQLLELYLNDKI